MPKVLSGFLSEIVAPLTRRLGTATGSLVVGIGATADQALCVENAVILVSGLVFDLALSFAARKWRS